MGDLLLIVTRLSLLEQNIVWYYLDNFEIIIKDDFEQTFRLCIFKKHYYLKSTKIVFLFFKKYNLGYTKC